MSERKIIISPEIKTIGPYSPAVAAGNLLFVSGQIGGDAQGNLPTALEDEIHNVMKNVGKVLALDNLTYNDIVKTSIFLTDMNDFAKVNELYGSYFENGNYPARETIQVSALPKKARVEISVIAFRK